MLVRRHFAYLGVSDSLLSLLIWGHIGPADVAELVDVLSRAESKQRDALVQLQALQAVEEDSLRAWAQFMERTIERSRAVTRREAIVRPSGTIGMIVSGFYGVVPVEYPTAIFASRDDACTWLRVPKAQRRVIASLSERVLAEARATPDTLYQLRELLAAQPARGTIVSVARALGTTERTLQRRLGEAGTSFERELGAARVAAAKTLLLRSGMAMKEIAHEVGLPSASRLSQLFAVHERTSPTEWRRSRV
jgi:AraC-like DNA-binding protein